MRRYLSVFALTACLAATVCGRAGIALAQPALPMWGGGNVTVMYIEPEGTIVFALDGAPNPCGGMYVLPRANANHREYYAALLAAKAAGRPVAVQVIACHGDRNIISHGNIS